MNHEIILEAGSESFEEYIENEYYYVDKTQYLQQIFLGNSREKAPLFIRPRRFGKTLNMDMIRSFCEINYQNPSDKSYQEKLFLDNGRNLAIANDEYKELRDKFMGEFPVISISFRNIEGRSYNNAIFRMLDTIADIYRKFIFLKDSTKINSSDRETFAQYFEFCKDISIDLTQENILSTAERIAINFIPFLAQMLYEEFDRKVLIIIDEYDVPLQKSIVAEKPYYNQMLEIIKGISNAIFKKDAYPWLLKGIVTGCLKIAHQSIFTGANNFVTYGMGDNPYTSFFGFTINETKKLLKYCELSDQWDTVKEWYDGYRIGNEHLFCPWSVVNFAKYAKNTTSTIQPQNYWINTSGNDIIKIYLERSINDNMNTEIDKLGKLLNGVPQEIKLKEFDIYPHIIDKGVNFDTFMTLLLQTGYLTFTDDSKLQNVVSLKIPNCEIKECFNSKMEELCDTSNPIWITTAKELISNLMENDITNANLIIDNLLSEFISLRDTGKEFLYHGFMIGILSLVAHSENIKLRSEHESGDGYSDIVLFKSDTKTAVILELKKCKNNEQARITASENAANQIIERNYAEIFIKGNYTKIYGLGIGFGGKSCKITSLGNLAK